MDFHPLAAGFPEADEAAWRALVEKALRGQDFEKTLVTRTYDGLRIDPLYQPATGAHDSGQPGAAPYSRGLHSVRPEIPWQICQLHANADPATINAAILEDLKGGVTAINLQIAAPGQFGLKFRKMSDLAAALDGVHLEFAPVYLNAGINFFEAASALQELWDERGISREAVSGGFDADPLGALASTGELTVALEHALADASNLAITAAKSYPNLSALIADGRLYHNGGATEAQELACICATLVAYLRVLEVAGLAPEQALPQIRIAVACDTNQFLSIAKLRALRLLVSRIASACGAEDALGKVNIHASTSVRMLSERDPYANMLRTVIACSSAALGGADAITVMPYTWANGQPDKLVRRMARNIQIILQEESALGTVMDPAGGSGYVEELTRVLAENAWEKFQDIERRGGMANALASGDVQAMIAETAAERTRALSTSGDEMVGVNAFAKICAKPRIIDAHPPVEVVENPAVTVEPIPLRRTSEAFDTMRRASLLYFDQFAKRPKIFLACLGKPKDYAARATFARQFFTAAGIVSVESDPLETPDQVVEAFLDSNCRIVCLCSSDAVYAEQAETVARQLNETHVHHIYMAGRPGENREALRKAGVGTFIYKGCDIVEILHDALDYLGIRV